MNYLKQIIYLYLISCFSCNLFPTEDYKDINYFTPKLLPDGHTVIVMKNIHKYSETGNPGGINTDEISSKWYLIFFNINSGSVSEININEFDFEPFWINKGITCATDTLVSIVNSFSTYLLNISNSELITLPTEFDIKDVNIDLNNQNLYLLEGFISYYIKTYNINTQSISELIVFDDYFGNMASSYLTNPEIYILWNTGKIGFVDVSNNKVKTLSADIKFLQIYDNNKLAVLNSQNQIQLYNFTADTLIYENSISVNANDVKDFSINQTADLIVYHATDLEHGGFIILKNVITQNERILFSSQHKKL